MGGGEEFKPPFVSTLFYELCIRSLDAGKVGQSDPCGHPCRLLFVKSFVGGDAEYISSVVHIVLTHAPHTLQGGKLAERLESLTAAAQKTLEREEALTKAIGELTEGEVRKTAVVAQTAIVHTSGYVLGGSLWTCASGLRPVTDSTRCVLCFQHGIATVWESSVLLLFLKSVQTGMLAATCTLYARRLRSRRGNDRFTATS